MTAELPPWLASGPATPELNAALRGQIERLLGDYDQVMDDLGRMQQRLRAAQGEAQSKDGLVRLTVGPRGELRSLHLDPRAYRKLSPSELAGEIIELSGTAARDVQQQLEQVLGPFLPAGLSYRQVADGEVDPRSWQPPAAVLREFLAGQQSRASRHQPDAATGGQS